MSSPKQTSNKKYSSAKQDVKISKNPSKYNYSCVRCNLFGLLCSRQKPCCRACRRLGFSCTYYQSGDRKFLTSGKSRLDYIFLKNYHILKFQKLNQNIKDFKSMNTKVLNSKRKRKEIFAGIIKKNQAVSESLQRQEPNRLNAKQLADILTSSYTRNIYNNSYHESLISSVTETENLELPNSSFIKSIYEAVSQNETSLPPEDSLLEGFDESAAIAMAVLAQEYIYHML